MSTHYVSNRWRVKRGHEEEFVTAFEAFALWAELHHPEGGTARLLQSIDRPSEYIGLWEFSGIEAIDLWQQHRDVARHLTSLAALADRVEDGAYELRVVVGG